MEEFVERGAVLEQTRSAQAIPGLRVLTSEGHVLGKVVEARLDKKGERVEGVLIRRRLSWNRLYISKDYIREITGQAILLSIEPSLLQRGRKVISKDGKVFGKAIEVHRVRNTNEVAHYIVRRRFKQFPVPSSEIALTGESIILHQTYDEAKQHFTP